MESKERLKYPGITMGASSLYHLALWLKAHNPRNKPHVQVRNQNRLNQYEMECRLSETIKASMSVGSALKGVRAVRDATEKDIQQTVERFDSLSNTSFQAYTKHPLRNA